MNSHLSYLLTILYDRLYQEVIHQHLQWNWISLELF